MVQIKPAKENNKKNNSKPGKFQPKKPQLQFASSDEDSDDDEEMDAEDEELLDEEFEDEDDLEGLEDEDDMEEFEDEDEEEDEEENEGKVPTKAELKAALANAKNKKAGQNKTNNETPLKTEKPTPVAAGKKMMEKSGTPANATPKNQQNGGKKQNNTPAKITAQTPAAAGKKGEKPAATPKNQQNAGTKNNTPAKAAVQQQQTNGSANDKGKKRKAEDPVTTKTPAAKLCRLGDNDAIVTEEARRREERNKRSLFFKGVGKLLRKNSEIKALNPDIVSVRSMGVNAWALFSNEAACEKAYKQLAEKNVKGKKLELDFCGSKAKRQSSNHKNLGRPVNKLALLVAGLPAGTTSEKLKVIFPHAKTIEIPAQKKNTSHNAFVHFATEQEAQAAFKKNESLKVGGAPVEVLYARQRPEK